jgi:hypothetical protein
VEKKKKKSHREGVFAIEPTTMSGSESFFLKIIGRKWKVRKKKKNKIIGKESKVKKKTSQGRNER